MRCESLLMIIGRHGENNTVRKMRPEEGKGRKIFHPAVVLMQYQYHTQPKITVAKHWYAIVAIIIIIVPTKNKVVIAWNRPISRHTVQLCALVSVWLVCVSVSVLAHLHTRCPCPTDPMFVWWTAAVASKPMQVFKGLKGKLSDSHTFLLQSSNFFFSCLFG